MRKRKIKKIDRKQESSLVWAPLDERLSPQKRKEAVLKLSSLVTKMVTHVICHTIVDYAELLQDERMSIAHAFLQRVSTTHLCNHKLTEEGLVMEYEGQSFQLHEEYKTMTLTRAVYEHLAMFYFLYEHPKTDEERDIVWNYWKINSKKNLLANQNDDDDIDEEEQRQNLEEVQQLRDEILSTPLGRQCSKRLSEWTNPDSKLQNGSIEFYEEEGKTNVRKVPYSQVWKYLYEDEEMAQVYRHLSMHCHPVYIGLVQYQNQPESDEGDECIPLYLSSSYLSYLCRLFLKTIPVGNDMLKKAFSQQELYIFQALSLLSGK